MSSLTSFVWKRRVGVIGRNDLIGIADFLCRACTKFFSSAIHGANSF
jgi:hypothetical protein